MVKIDDVQTIAFRLPLKHPLYWGKYHKLSELCHVLVKVILSDGSFGYSEAPPRPTIYGETVESIKYIIRDELAPRIKGLPTESEYELQNIHDKLNEIKNNHCAKSGVDIALYDAMATHQGKKLLDYIGGIPKKIKVSYILGMGNNEKTEQEVEEIYKNGVRVFKIKIGKNIELETKMMKKLKDIYGNKIEIYADANECLRPDEAENLLKKYSDYGLLYCEEPLPIELIRERSHLKSKQVMPLIADDSTMSTRDLQRELEFGTFDILNIKTARTGFTDSKKMLESALKQGKGVMVGSQATSTIGTIRSAYFASLPSIEYPCELSYFLNLVDDITDKKIIIHDGYIDTGELSTIQIDEHKLKEFTLN